MRPTDYREEYNRMARVACAEGGFTDKKLAELFDVCEATINNWKKDYPEFLESIKEGKDIYNSERAEKSLLRRVLGFAYTETTQEDKDGVMKVTKKVRKRIPPETKAIEMWLTNRDPKRWKKLKHVELGGTVDFNLETFNAIIDQLPAEYARAIRTEIRRRTADRNS